MTVCIGGGGKLRGGHEEEGRGEGVEGIGGVACDVRGDYYDNNEEPV